MAKPRGTAVEVLMADKTTRKCVITRKGLGSNGRISVRCIDRDSRFYGRTYEIVPKRVLSYEENADANADALVELTIMEADEDKRMKKYYDKAQEGKTPEQWLNIILKDKNEVKRGMFVSVNMPDGSTREGFVTRDGLGENGRISIYAVYNSGRYHYGDGMGNDRRYEINPMQLNGVYNDFKSQKWVVKKRKGAAPLTDSLRLEDKLEDDSSWKPDNKNTFVLTGSEYLDMVEKWEDMCNPSWLKTKEKAS